MESTGPSVPGGRVEMEGGSRGPLPLWGPSRTCSQLKCAPPTGFLSRMFRPLGNKCTELPLESSHELAASLSDCSLRSPHFPFTGRCHCHLKAPTFRCTSEEAWV